MFVVVVANQVFFHPYYRRLIVSPISLSLQMKSIRSRDVAIMMLSVVIMAVECSAVKVDLVELLRERNRNPTRLSQKRVVGGKSHNGIG